MFALPPRPPKNHILKDVTLSQASSDLFTPSAPPRATQTTIAKFPSPLLDDNNLDESPDQEEIEPLNPRLLKKLIHTERASWVEKPGANAPFVHSIHKKYSLDHTEPCYKYTRKHFLPNNSNFSVAHVVFQPRSSRDRLNTSSTGWKR